MKNIEIILEALGEKIKDLETSCFLKDCEIERLKKAEVEKRPSTARAEETR